MPPATAPPPSAITAVILAGGASSRMGTDKALLDWRGRPFLAHIIDALRPQVDGIVINGPATPALMRFGLPLIADASAERRGPLAGIMAALDFGATEFILVVPCDNPLLSPHLAARLRAALEREGSDVAYAGSGSDNHYLYALMRTDLRDALATFLRAGDYAVRHWYATLRATRVDFSAEPEHFRNVNDAGGLASLNGHSPS